MNHTSEESRSRLMTLSRAGRYMVYISFIYLILSIFFLGIGDYMRHGLLITLYAIPSFVTGVFYHMLSIPNRKAPPTYLVYLSLSTILVSSAVFLININYITILLHLIFLLTVLLETLYCYYPIKRGYLPLQIMGPIIYTTSIAIDLTYIFASHTLTTIGLLYLIALPTGMILAVNSFHIPNTYRRSVSSSATVALDLLYLSTVTTTLHPKYFGYLFLTTILAYIYNTKIYLLPNYIADALSKKDISKYIHLNLLTAHTISISMAIISTTLLLTETIPPIEYLHILYLGFVLPEIAGHGTSLLPIVLKKKARKTKIVATTAPTSILPAIARIAGNEIPTLKPLSGIAVIIVVALTLLASTRLR